MQHNPEDKIHIVLITRFCYPGRRALEHIGGSGNSFTNDPLEPDHLAHRWELLNTFCKHSILSQTDQNFSWVILIDTELPERYKKLLEAFKIEKEDCRIHTYFDHDKIEFLDWLKPSIPDDTDFVITVNHDDDDMMPRTYIEAMLKEAQSITESEIPNFKFFGTSSILQWDLSFSRKFPFGKIAPWHRDTKISSCGFGLGVLYPDFNLCVLGLVHSFAYQYVAFGEKTENRNVIFFRSFVQNFVESKGEKWVQNAEEKLIYDLSDQQVLMTNHVRNVQNTRRYERKENSKPADASLLKNFDIPWPQLEKQKSNHAKSFYQLLRYKVDKWTKKLAAALGFKISKTPF